jgi:Fe-S cluster assembly ATPase SufC
MRAARGLGVLPEQADVAVLDEIDSGLDIDALRDVADAVNGLKRPQSATIMVTHYKVPILAPTTPFRVLYVLTWVQ